jgi:ribosomal protein S18 acetylase RimI-like enzyme
VNVADIRVRPATPDDLPAIEALELEVFARTSGVAGLCGPAAATDRRWWVAVACGAVVAFLSAVVVAGEIEIHDLAVGPAVRRRGVARKLLDGVLLAAAEVGVGRAVLEVGERNGAARALYEGAGFRVCGRRRGYYRAGAEDALILERPIP